MSYSYHGRAWERQQCQQVANQIENQLLNVPTTKTCICTEKLNLTLADRRIVCPRCGYTADRDVHAARNMLVFAQDANNIKVGQGLSEFTLVESAFPAHDRKIMGKWRSMKQEATLL